MQVLASGLYDVIGRTDFKSVVHRMVRKIETRNIPLNPLQVQWNPGFPPQEPPDPSEAEMENLRNMFPCLYPTNPHMSRVEARIETFDFRWPTANISASSEQIARAGFYYLGDRDRVKCWYCNGGLQNWETDDEPWKEHAKWFPTCDFLLQNKGPEFVHRIVALYPHLRRPVLRGPFDVPPPGRYLQEEIPEPPAPPPPVIDPRAEKRRIEEELNKAMTSDPVREAQRMGFPLRLIKRCIKRKLESGGRTYESVSTLIEDLTNEENNSMSDDDDDDNDEDEQRKIKDEETNQRPSGSGITSSLSPSNIAEQPSMQNRIQELETERQCKVCLDRPADVVFVPCGHLCCCVMCATGLRKCPICRSKIEKAIRTYVS